MRPDSDDPALRTGGAGEPAKRTVGVRDPDICVETPFTGTGRSRERPILMVYRAGRRRPVAARPACTLVGSRTVARNGTIRFGT